MSRAVRLGGLACVLAAGYCRCAVVVHAGEGYSLTWSGPTGLVGFAVAEIAEACRFAGEPLQTMGSTTRAGPGLSLIPRRCPAASVIDSGIASLPEEAGSYLLQRVGDPWVVASSNAVGVMYGGLELAEALRLGKLESLTNGVRRPHIAKRGIKFNIPLDLRTPSYSDCSDAAQQNIPEMWSMDFWRAFLDAMARDRYNVLTLWSLHPFPSIVKVPEYPAVALDDVWRTRAKLDDTFSFSGGDMVRPAMLKDVEVVKRMSIDEKIRFWRGVMDHAADRGIEVYWFTWNTFTFGTEGHPGLTPNLTNRETVAYFRASVRETVKTYPRLAGIGITAGEQMPQRAGLPGREAWLWTTYGEGMRDALKDDPGRDFRLIHRFHMTGQEEILRAWKDYPGPLDLSFKYAIAHMYSATNPPFIRDTLPQIRPDHPTWLTVRNDDLYSFRWGDPQFARHFIQCMPGPDRMAGFYMGPDGYTWGRDFLSRDSTSPPPLVWDRQWFSFMLWGRLAYDPEIPDEHFQRVLAARFPGVDAAHLLAAWSEASRIIPQVTRFFWGDIDLKWYPEACLSHPRHRGFYTVRDFVEGRTMPGSGLLDILTWRDRLAQERPMEGGTPIEVAEALERHAQAATEGAVALRGGAQNSVELGWTLADVETMGHLGRYYAEKIRAAADLGRFDASGDDALRASAVSHARTALAHWERYAMAHGQQYKPALFNRVGFVDIPGLTGKVRADIDIAAAWKPGSLRTETRRRESADIPFRR